MTKEILENHLAATKAELEGADKVIANLKGELEKTRALCIRAADKLQKLRGSFDFIHASVWEAHEVPELIAELREAGK